MTPILFISIVTVILVALVYWILSSHDTQSTGTRRYNSDHHNFSFETAQELLKYVNEEEISRQDVLRLKFWDQDIMVYWQISPDTWDETITKYGLRNNYDHIVIRLYDPNLHIRDIEVHNLTGGQRVKIGEFHVNYAVLGINKKGDFIPLFLSRTVE